MKNGEQEKRCSGSARYGVLVVLLLTACAKPLVQVPHTAGPEPGPEPGVLPPQNTGRLVVATEDIKGGNVEEFSRYEPYSVLDSFGRLVREVENDSGADVVQLPAGHYSVHVQTLRRRIIAIEVQVIAGRTTEIHLDGNWKPRASTTPAALVFGSEGSPIGYRSVAMTTSAANDKAP